MAGKKTIRKKKWWLIIGIPVIVLLVGCRIVLPYVLLRVVNKELNTITGYKGHVDDIDVALFRGAYIIKGHPLKIAWEAVISSVAWILKNHSKDQLATKAEFSGSIKDPDINVWFIIGQVLRNAFIQALYPSLENSVSISSIKGDNKKDNTLLKKEFDKTKNPKK